MFVAGLQVFEGDIILDLSFDSMKYYMTFQIELVTNI